MPFWSKFMDPIREYYGRLQNKAGTIVGTEGVDESPKEVPKGLGDTPLSDFKHWIWPFPEVFGNHPTVSDGYGVKKRFNEKTQTFKGHFGSDIMYPRRRIDAGRAEVKAPPKGITAKNFLLYIGIPVIAVGPGKVFSSKKTNTGTEVKISHNVNGRPILSVYRHLQSSLVQKDQIVAAGTALGLPGDNPASAGDPPHLHFELWDTAHGSSYPEWTIDPMSIARDWKVIRSSDSEKVSYRGTHKFGPDKLPLASILFALGASGLLVNQLLKAWR